MLALLLAASCQREQVTHARVPKGAPLAGSGMVPPLPRAPGGERPAEAAMPPSGIAAAAAKPAAGGLQWTLPSGWKQTMTEGIRYATLQAPVEGQLEVSVVVLGGPAGGELANVNRWRGQLGLAEVDEAGLSSVRTPLQTRAGALSLYDFTGEAAPRSRIIVALLAASDGNSWFVKMTGDAAPVSAARGDFVRLLESLRFD